VDDNITLNPKRLIELCNAIVDDGLDHIHYHTQASAKGIAYSPEVARKMAKAGFKFTFLGIENVLQKNLDFFNKGQMSNDADVAVRNLRENNIIVSGGLIMGTPEDTKEDMWENFKAARDMKIDIPIFYISTPYPKTELRKELLDMGLVTNVDDFTRYDGLTANIRTKQMTDREIQLETWKMAAQFYDSNWKNYTTIHRTYPLWFAKKATILSVKYIRRKLLRLLGLKTIEDFFEEDCKARTFNMSVY
jgi:anaerobic magnesium-protoporphyrin IX monomethyl ester cyclase